ncbi:MAG: phosphate signaling complex PhoU family protein [Candidatus Thorarchaeota archaeon]
MSSQIDRHLKKISTQIKKMYKLSSKTLMESMAVFKSLDKEKVANVKTESQNIEDLADRIEANIFETIARRQPVARDLRKLATYLQVSHHLYRIGRYAFKVAHIVELCQGLEHYKELISLPHLANLARQTLDIAMNAILTGDLSKIEELEKLEFESDRETEEMFEEISEFLRKRTDITQMSLYYVIVGRYFERAADNAFSIAERAIYMVTGEKKQLGLAFKRTKFVGPH